MTNGQKMRKLFEEKKLVVAPAATTLSPRRSFLTSASTPCT